MQQERVLCWNVQLLSFVLECALLFTEIIFFNVLHCPTLLFSEYFFINVLECANFCLLQMALNVLECAIVLFTY